MALLGFFHNNQGCFRVPSSGLDAEIEFGASINAGSISTNNGLPEYAHSISIRHMEFDRPGKLSYSTLRTLLENTPRKLGKIQLLDQVPSSILLSQEYLDLLACICNKAERLDFEFSRLSHTAEIECLATALAQPNGPTELAIDLCSFDTPEKKQSLQHLFRSIGASSSLKKLEIGSLPDLSEENLGNLLIQALQANRCSIKTLFLHGHWGDESDMMVEKVMSAILEHTQVKELRVFSRKIRSFEIEDSSVCDKLTRHFFEKLATARHLKDLELNRNLLLESASYLNSFEDAISRNTCLERLHMRFDYRDVRKQEWQRRHDEKLYVRLCVNRAAGGLDHSTPLGLWPHVLQRAGRITYYTVERKEDYNNMEDFATLEDERKSPSSERSKTDVVFSLLRERVLLS